MTKKSLIQYVGVIIFFFFLGSVVSAQEKVDIDLEELLSSDLEDIAVWVASKRKEKLSQAPGIISVITAKDIQSYGANNLQDLFLRLPNVYVWGSGLARDNVVSIRGQVQTHLDNHVLVLLNGRPVRGGTSSGVQFDIYRNFPLESIERIEMVRGPGSVLYGTNAFAGVINIVSKDPRKSQKNSISTGYGSFGTAQTSGQFNVSKGEFSLTYSARFFDSDGWKFRAVDSASVADSVDYSQENQGFFAQAIYKDLSVTGFRSFQDDTTIGVPPRFPALTRQEVTRNYIDAQFLREFAADWEGSFNFTFNSVDFTSSSGAETVSRDLLFEPYIRGVLFDKVNVLSGFIYQHLMGEFRSSLKEYNEDRFSYYLQTDFSPWERLNLIAGFQLNKTENNDVDLSPRVGANLKLTPRLGVKTLYAKAFRSASPTEREVDFSAIKGNPNLEPESINTFDAQIFYNAPQFFVGLTYYNSVQEDTIGRALQSDNTLLFTNQGEVDYWGLELEGKMYLTPEWEFSGSASYQENENDQGLEDISLIPNFMAKAGVSYRSSGGYSLALFNSYFTEATSVPGSPQLNPEPDSYNFLTFKGALEMNQVFPEWNGPDLTLSVFGENLLGEDVFVPNFNGSVNTIPWRSGTAFWGTATVKF